MPSSTHRALLAAAALALLPAAVRAQIAVVGETVQEREAAPGTSYEGTITVRNASRESREVRVTQTDYRFRADGQTVYGPAGTSPRSNAGWVAVSPSRLVVAGGDEVEIRYRVSVPTTAGADTLRGTYWSLVMVEGLAPVEPDLPAGQRSLGVRATVRYAVQVVTHLGASGAPKIAFSGAAATSTPDGLRLLDVDLPNEGDRAGRIALTLELYSADGKPLVTLRQPRGLVYPGTAIHQRFVLGDLPPGTYKALLVADAGADAVFGAQYTLRF